jgi:hypothetical protein
MREAAYYIKEKFGPGKRIGATRSQIAYYAEGVHVPLSSNPSQVNLDTVDLIAVRFARRESGEYDTEYLKALESTGRIRRVREFGQGFWVLEVCPRR